MTSGFRRLSEDRLFEGHLFSVSRVTLSAPDGMEFSREIVRHPGAVAIVPVHEDGTVTLVRQMRVAVGEAVLEAPAGTCDVEGEELEDTARRELAEEAGLRARHVVRLAAVYNSPGYTSQVTTLFLATGLQPCDTERDGVEERWMSVETVPLDGVEGLVAAGRIVDSTTIVGLFLARGARTAAGLPGAP